MRTEWARCLSAGGIEGLKALRYTEYGMREFTLIDPDGNMLLFGSPRSGA